MPVRASRRPSRAPAFPFPPPGPPGDLGLSRDLGLPVASPWAQRLLQAASPRGRESGERLPGSRGGPCVPDQGSAEPSPSRRPARFRSPRGPSRTHEAAARPFPLPIRSPRARAAFRAPVWPFRLFVSSVRAPCGLYRSRSGLHARISLQCSGLGARARSFPPRGLGARPAPPAAVLGAARRRRPPVRKALLGPSRGCPQRTAARPDQLQCRGTGRGGTRAPPLFPSAGGDGRGASCLAVP